MKQTFLGSPFLRVGPGIYAVLAVGALANALLFANMSATPLVQADGWYFLENFLARYFEHGFQLTDLFIQRGANDHAQPIQKLVLLFHTKFFDMDFRIEGLIGVVFGALFCWVIASAMGKQQATAPRAQLGYALTAMIFVIGLSINATNIFTWPLVTLGYSALLLASLFYVLYAWAAPRSNYTVLGVATAVLGLTIDEIAIIAAGAAIAAGTACRLTDWRNAMRCGGAAVAGLLVARGILAWLASRAHVESTALDASEATFSALLAQPGAWKSLVIPLSASVVHGEHLSKWFGESAMDWAAFIATSVFILHAYFWYSVFAGYRDGNASRQRALAVALMLTSYGLTLGVVLSRVPTFGWDYLHQPRYVLFYQLALVAVVVLMHERLSNPGASRFYRRGELGFISVVCAALLLSQVVVARYSWQLPQYLTSYWQNASFKLGDMASNPAATVDQCPDIFVICGYDAERRARVVGMLRDRGLNIFSPAFQGRNRLYPTPAGVPGMAERLSKPPQDH